MLICDSRVCRVSLRVCSRSFSFEQQQDCDPSQILGKTDNSENIMKSEIPFHFPVFSIFFVLSNLKKKVFANADFQFLYLSCRRYPGKRNALRAKQKLLLFILFSRHLQRRWLSALGAQCLAAIQ